MLSVMKITRKRKTRKRRVNRRINRKRRKPKRLNDLFAVINFPYKFFLEKNIFNERIFNSAEENTEYGDSFQTILYIFFINLNFFYKTM